MGFKTQQELRFLAYFKMQIWCIEKVRHWGPSIFIFENDSQCFGVILYLKRKVEEYNQKSLSLSKEYVNKFLSLSDSKEHLLNNVMFKMIHFSDHIIKLIHICRLFLSL